MINAWHWDAWSMCKRLKGNCYNYVDCILLLRWMNLWPNHRSDEWQWKFLQWWWLMTFLKLLFVFICLIFKNKKERWCDTEQFAGFLTDLKKLLSLQLSLENVSGKCLNQIKLIIMLKILGENRGNCGIG